MVVNLLETYRFMNLEFNSDDYSKLNDCKVGTLFNILALFWLMVDVFFNRSKE